jgi:hypothetical protein
VVVYDLVELTATFSGANNVMQRPGIGSVIRWDRAQGLVVGQRRPHPVLRTGHGERQDFCRAIA